MSFFSTKVSKNCLNKRDKFLSRCFVLQTRLRDFTTENFNGLNLAASYPLSAGVVDMRQLTREPLRGLEVRINFHIPGDPRKSSDGFFCLRAEIKVYKLNLF